MILPANAVVAVADGHNLTLFRNAGTNAELRLVPMDGPANLSGEAGSGGRHHSSSANPDSHRLAEDDFAAAAANWLNTQVLGGKIDALFVIATPKTLGELRLGYHAELRAKLLGEESKDMIGRSAAEIESLIAKAK